METVEIKEPIINDSNDSNQMKYKEFNLDEFYNLLCDAKKQFPNVDTTLLQFAVGSYLMYEVGGLPKPDDSNEEFVNVNKKLAELIQNTKEITKEIEENDKRTFQYCKEEITIENPIENPIETPIENPIETPA